MMLKIEPHVHQNMYFKVYILIMLKKNFFEVIDHGFSSIIKQNMLILLNISNKISLNSQHRCNTSFYELLSHKNLSKCYFWSYLKMFQTYTIWRKKRILKTCVLETFWEKKKLNHCLQQKILGLQCNKDLSAPTTREYFYNEPSYYSCSGKNPNPCNYLRNYKKKEKLFQNNHQQKSKKDKL